MDATEILCEIAEAFYHAGLEAVMIGNAAAAIQGAPVTTLDIDFCVEETDQTLLKLQKVAHEMEAELINYAPLFQIQAPEREIYLDFICNVIGVKSFEYLLERSLKVSFDGIYSLQIASLEDIIASKEAVGQEKDMAVLPLLRHTMEIRNGKEPKKSR